MRNEHSRHHNLIIPILVAWNKRIQPFLQLTTHSGGDEMNAAGGLTVGGVTSGELR